MRRRVRDHRPMLASDWSRIEMAHSDWLKLPNSKLAEARANYKKFKSNFGWVPLFSVLVVSVCEHSGVYNIIELLLVLKKLASYQVFYKTINILKPNFFQHD